MNKFEIAKPIVACHISKELLIELEKYIRYEIPKQIGISKETIYEKYSISIQDESGEEKIKEIFNYPLSIFPDSTNKIEIQVYVYQPKDFTFLINFDKEYSGKYNKIKISYESDNARETALGIYEGIKRIIESHRNHNEFFHPSLGIEIIIDMTKFLFFYTSFFLIYQKYHILALISFLIFLGMIIYQFTGNVFKRYITFETNYNSKLQKSFKFYRNVLLSLLFLILGIIITQNWNRLFN
jgi:hypothetical protein